MPKSRKTKAKHQDWQKVKLKVGKTLPRGTNETIATFKSKGIEIKTQFKDANGQPTTRKKQSITDLLSHCQHYNTNMKVDALIGLKEILVSNPQLIATHISTILSKLSELFVDKDASVRENVHKLLRQVFLSLPQAKISPFFALITTHLSCAMTHISDDIQMDSLTVIDILLDSYPKLTVSGSIQLLPHFIDQISRKTSQMKKGNKSSGNIHQRTLLVNPGSKIGSPKWRVKVLERLNKFLKASLSSRESEYDTDPNQESKHRLAKLEWNSLARSSVTLLGSHALETNIDKGIILRPEGWLGAEGGADTGADVLSSADQLGAFLQTLVPLLLQAWVEVGPSQLTSQLPGNELSGLSVGTLQSVLQVLQMLFDYIYKHMASSPVNMEWVRQQYEAELVKHFMIHFPFTMNESLPVKKGKGTQHISMLSLNLCVCDTMTLLSPQGLNVINPVWLEDIIQYIPEMLRSTQRKLNTAQLSLTLTVVRRLLHSNTTDGQREELLQAVLHVCPQWRTGTKEFCLITNFFASVLYDGSGRFSIERSDTVQKWICSLLSSIESTGNVPHENSALLQKSYNAILKAAHLAITRGSSDVQQILQNKVQFLIEKLAELQNPEQRIVVEILANIKTFSPAQMSRLASVCQKPEVLTDILRYLLQVLTHRLCYPAVQSSTICDADLLLSFLFTIALGCGQRHIRELQQLQQSPPPVAQIAILLDSTFLLPSAALHKAKLEVVVGALQQTDHTVVMEAWSHFFTSVCSNAKCLPMPVAYSLVSMSTHLHTMGAFSQHCHPDYDGLKCHLITALLYASCFTLGSSIDDFIAKKTVIDRPCQVAGNVDIVIESVPCLDSQVTSLVDMEDAGSTSEIHMETKSVVEETATGEQARADSTDAVVDFPGEVSAEDKESAMDETNAKTDLPNTSEGAQEWCSEAMQCCLTAVLQDACILSGLLQIITVATDNEDAISLEVCVEMLTSVLKQVPQQVVTAKDLDALKSFQSTVETTTVLVAPRILAAFQYQLSLMRGAAPLLPS